MEGIKGGEEGALTSLDKLAARYTVVGNAIAVSRGFNADLHCSPIVFFSIVHQKILANHARRQNVSTIGKTVHLGGGKFEKWRSWSNDICASGGRSRGQPCQRLELEIQHRKYESRACSLVFSIRILWNRGSSKCVCERERERARANEWSEDRASFRPCRWYPWLVRKVNVDNVREYVNWLLAIVRLAWSTTERQRSGRSDDRRLIASRTQIFQHPIACQPPSFPSTRISIAHDFGAHESLWFFVWSITLVFSKNLFLHSMDFILL